MNRGREAHDGGRAAIRTAQTVQKLGFWRVGWDQAAGVTWPDAPSSWYMTGSVRYAAVSTSALGAARIRDRFVAGS